MSIKMICYLSCGYPTVERSMEMAEYYIEGGCDAIEMSIPPKDPYRDGPFIQDLMRKALAGCDDYDFYLENIRKFAIKHPNTELFLLLYHEVIMSIGYEKLADFC
ncbi:MAG: tryptophan synthase subunit alpha, partial [Christensenella sp.]